MAGSTVQGHKLQMTKITETAMMEKITQVYEWLLSGFNVLDHPPPYLPQLASSDLRVFLKQMKLKEDLRERHFLSDYR
jgi:hypothetical protein